METPHTIYLDRLREGNSEELAFESPPESLEINEKDLFFVKPIQGSGEAYIVDGELVVHLTLASEASMPCKICNEMVVVPIQLSGIYHTVSLKEIKGATYDFFPAVREEILLAVPPFAECQNGHCPKRDELKQYLHEEKQKNEENDADGYRPFANL